MLELESTRAGHPASDQVDAEIASQSNTIIIEVGSDEANSISATRRDRTDESVSYTHLTLPTIYSV